MKTTSNFTHPLLWSFVLLAFVVIVAFFFRHWYVVGAEIGVNHPRPIEEEGVEIPDHAAFITAMDASELAAGKAIYEGNCMSCHGADGNLGSNNARRFGQEEFVNGADPYNMYLTLVNGLNAMPNFRLTLSTEEKYAVVHYIRQSYLKESNPSQYVEITEDYIANGAWPPPGMGGGAVAIPYGDNKLKPLSVPVMAVSQQFVERNAPESLVKWNQLVAQSDLDGSLKGEWTAPVSTFAATKLLEAIESEDSELFPLIAGDVLPGAALLPKSELIAARTALKNSLNSTLQEPTAK